MITCQAENAEAAQKYASILVTIVEKYKHLSGAYMVDYYTNQHWNKIQSTWQTSLQNMEPSQLASWLVEGISPPGHQPLPLSLQAYRKVCLAFSLSRTPIEGIGSLMDQLTTIKLGGTSHLQTRSSKGKDGDSLEESREKKFPLWKSKASEEMTSTGYQHALLEHTFRKHVKPKKQHEIFRLAEVVAAVCSCSGNHCVVDVGSGQGHLARYLSMNFGLDVVTMEANGCHVDAGKKFDREAIDFTKKKENKATSGVEAKLKPSHHILQLHETSTANEFDEILSSKDSKVCLVGLHTCGNLGAMIPELFTKSKRCSNLVSVACCYMKISEERFPVSTFLRSRQSHLDYDALELACHATEAYIQRLRMQDPSLRIHCWRAKVESLLDVKRNSALGRRLKFAKHESFSSYARTSMKKLGHGEISEMLLKRAELECEQNWKCVVGFYILRLLLARVIESLVLLDRMLALRESGVDSCLFACFDPCLSPRNHVLLAFK